MEQCKTCRTIPILLGKKILMPLLGREYRKLLYKDVRGLLEDLDIKVVGGLKERGWTTHDIDIVGNENDIPLLAARLKSAGIPHPIHHCKKQPFHSHMRCAWNGIKLAFTGKGY